MTNRKLNKICNVILDKIYQNDDFFSPISIDSIKAYKIPFMTTRKANAFLQYMFSMGNMIIIKNEECYFSDYFRQKLKKGILEYIEKLLSPEERGKTI